MDAEANENSPLLFLLFRVSQSCTFLPIIKKDAAHKINYDVEKYLNEPEIWIYIDSIGRIKLEIVYRIVVVINKIHDITFIVVIM